MSYAELFNVQYRRASEVSLGISCEPYRLVNVKAAWPNG